MSAFFKNRFVIVLGLGLVLVIGSMPTALMQLAKLEYVRRAEMDLNRISAAMLAFKEKNGRFPQLEELCQAQPKGGPALLKESDLIDPWGNRYFCSFGYLDTGRDFNPPWPVSLIKPRYDASAIWDKYGADIERVIMDQERISAAFKSFKEKNGDVPPTLEALCEKQPGGGPALLNESDLIDPWGRRYKYEKGWVQGNRYWTFTTLKPMQNDWNVETISELPMQQDDNNWRRSYRIRADDSLCFIGSHGPPPVHDPISLVVGGVR
jgi:Type II secretion system (T2SS), protein G